MQQNVHRHPYCFCTLVGCESVSAASGQISLHAIQFNMATKASALPCTVHYSAQAHLLYNCSARSCQCFSPGQCIASCLPSWIIAGRQCMHHQCCADFVWPPMCMAIYGINVLSTSQLNFSTFIINNYECRKATLSSVQELHKLGLG